MTTASSRPTATAPTWIIERPDSSTPVTDSNALTAIDLLVFDFDGTLVDTKHDIAYSANLALEEIGLRPLPDTTLFGFVGKGVLNLMSQALSVSLGGTDNPIFEPSVKLSVTLFMEHYEQHLMNRTVFFPQCREVLDHFADKKKAVLSNKPERFIRLILEELNSAEAFDAIAGGDTYAKKKPDPMGLLDLMKQLEVDPERVLMIGDSQVDIDTGRAAGVKTCGVTFGHATREEMEALQPDWVIDDMTELTRYFA